MLYSVCDVLLRSHVNSPLEYGKYAKNSLSIFLYIYPFVFKGLLFSGFCGSTKCKSKTKLFSDGSQRL